MKIMILGAGAVGGYFGGAMQMAGLDVSFFVRPDRAKTLLAKGLEIEGDLSGSQNLSVKVLSADDGKFAPDLVILACKAYDLDAAIGAITPFIARGGIVLPLLNGMRHMDILGDRFGADAIIGGTCKIFADLTADKVVHQIGALAELTYGLLASQQQRPMIKAAADRIGEILQSVKCISLRRVDPAERALWDKWALLAPMAAMTSMLRGNVGDIQSTQYGAEVTRSIIDEVATIAKANGFPLDVGLQQQITGLLTKKDASFAASMAKDIAKKKRTEADHIIGDLIARAQGVDTPILKAAYTHLQVYERTLLTS